MYGPRAYPLCGTCGTCGKQGKTSVSLFHPRHGYGLAQSSASCCRRLPSGTTRLVGLTDISPQQGKSTCAKGCRLARQSSTYPSRYKESTAMSDLSPQEQLMLERKELEALISDAEQRIIRNIVGSSYDREHGDPPERFQMHRRLSVTAIPSAYEKPSHAVIAISGTPCRGLVVVDLVYSGVFATDYYSGRHLNAHQTEILRNFARKVAALASTPNANTWSWSTTPPKA